jgi:hypothetical protein
MCQVKWSVTGGSGSLRAALLAFALLGPVGLVACADDDDTDGGDTAGTDAAVLDTTSTTGTGTTGEDGGATITPDTGTSEIDDPTGSTGESSSTSTTGGDDPTTSATDGGEVCLAGGQCLANEDCEGERDYCDLAEPDADGCGRCRPICVSDDECVDPAHPRCNRLTGLCQMPFCSSDTQCVDGEVCIGAEDGLSATCQPNPAVKVETCRVVSPSVSLAVGGKAPLRALAFDSAGNAVSRAAVAWRSGDASIAIPESHAASATLQAVGPGETVATASVDSGTDALPVQCDGLVAVRVLAPPANGRAVIVLDALDGTPVTAASLSASTGGQSFETGVSASGVALFDALARSAPMTVHISAPGYVGTTVVGLSSRVSRVFLERSKSSAPDATATGEIRFPPSRIGDVVAGFAGYSQVGSLTGFTLRGAVGPNGPPTLSCESLGFVDPVPLPIASVFLWPPDFCDGQKPEFQISGRPGPRLLWGFAGQLSLNDILPLFIPLISLVDAPQIQDLELPVEVIAAKLFPFVGEFDHGIESPASLQPGAQVEGADVSVSSRLALPIIVKAPTLPTVGGSTLGAATFVAGVNHRELGFVPLGFGFGFDRAYRGELEPGDGVVTPDESATALRDGEMAASSTRAHGPLESVAPYTLLLLASRVDEFPDAGARAGIVRRSATLPSDLDFSAQRLPPMLEDAAWNPAERRVTLPGASRVSGETFRRLALEGCGGPWVVYAPAGTESIELPFHGDVAGGDSESRFVAEAVWLEATTYDALFDAASAVSTLDVNDLITAFSVWPGGARAPSAKATAQ